MKNNYTTIITFLQGPLQKIITVIGEKLNFVKRLRKVNALSLVLALIGTALTSKNMTMPSIVDEFKKQGGDITVQGVLKRLNENAVKLLREILFTLFEHLSDNWNVQGEYLKLTKKFSGVYIADCTNIKLSESLEDKYKGCGRTSDKAGMKLFVRLNLLNGKITQFEIRPGRTSDQKFKGFTAPLPKNSLVLHDRGFYNIKQLQQREEKGSFYISRVMATTIIWYKGVKYTLSNFLSMMGQKADSLDVMVLVGGDKFPTRLVASKVTKEVENKRRKKLREKARTSQKRRKKEPSKVQLDICKWTVYITNLPSAEYDTEVVHTLYRTRWQIELLFKHWKSEGGLAVPPCKNGEKNLCLVYAKMISILLTHSILNESGSQINGQSVKRRYKVIKRYADELFQAMYTNQYDEVLNVLQKTINHMKKVDLQHNRHGNPSTRNTLIKPPIGIFIHEKHLFEPVFSESKP